MSKNEVMAKVREILQLRCDDPAEQMIREGQALVEIGRALKGLSAADARAVIYAVSALEGA